MLPVASATDLQMIAGSSVQPPSDSQLELQEKFQEFVAGTFFQQMLKSLRSAQSPPAYFHGGQAEEIFQSQMDQQVAENLAHQQGGAISDPLFQQFSRMHPEFSSSKPQANGADGITSLLGMSRK